MHPVERFEVLSVKNSYVPHTFATNLLTSTSTVNLINFNDFSDTFNFQSESHHCVYVCICSLLFIPTQIKVFD